MEDIKRATDTNKLMSDCFEHDEMVENEIDDAIEAKHEKLANKAWEDTGKEENV